MLEHRLQNVDDYLAILRRYAPVIMVSTLAATVITFLLSFCFPPEYKSKSLVVVEKQTVPAGYVRPIVTTTPIDRIITLQRQILSRSRLETVVTHLGLVRKGRTADEAIDQIQKNIAITEADSPSPSAGSSSSSLIKRGTDFTGFYITFTTDNPTEAQRVCSEITAMLLSENLKMREQVAVSTTDFLSRQLAEAKKNLDDKDAGLSAFKSRHLGQLPGDVANNLKILEGLNSELDANTQALNRAQQDKSYTQSVLDQQLAGWKSSQTSQTSESIGQRLVTLKTQLIALQARYTEDHPEVIKMKKDIAALAAKQKEMNSLDAKDDSPETVRAKAEPPGILQLRSQIHQTENVITRATSEEKRIKALIETYQARLTLSPRVEEQYAQMTRDNEVAHKLYDSLLLNKSESEEQSDLEHRQQGEQMRLLDPATLPNSVSFPVRWKFAAGGLVGGLALGMAFAFWKEIRDQALRDERDVRAALALPLLTAMPWVGPSDVARNSGISGRMKTLFGH